MASIGPKGFHGFGAFWKVSTPDAYEEFNSDVETGYMDTDEDYDWGEDSAEDEDETEMDEYEETPEDVQLAEAMEDTMSVDN
ncbi:hypothetical protein BDZ45DRAFT_810107 [Acephala macrosclerotiorum]|nr:hypothetical protein BDZ45DRAFT_810107 [Acephala macrosclerotiorum]